MCGSPRDLGPVRFGDLHGERSHASRGAVDQHRLSRPDVTLVAKALQGREGRHGHGRGFFEGQFSRLEHEFVLIDAGVFGVSSVAAVPDDVVAWLEPFDAGPDGLDPARHVGSEDPALGLQQTAAQEPEEERIGPQMAPVVGVDGRRPDFDQYLMIFGRGLPDLFEMKDIGRPVLLVDDGSHDLILAHFFLHAWAIGPQSASMVNVLSLRLIPQ